jgi:hypothetical protein
MKGRLALVEGLPDQPGLVLVSKARMAPAEGLGPGRRGAVVVLMSGDEDEAGCSCRCISGSGGDEG